jgi:hypothetical protein
VSTPSASRDGRPWLRDGLINGGPGDEGEEPSHLYGGHGRAVHNSAERALAEAANSAMMLPLLPHLLWALPQPTAIMDSSMWVVVTLRATWQPGSASPDEPKVRTCRESCAVIRIRCQGAAAIELFYVVSPPTGRGLTDRSHVVGRLTAEASALHRAPSLPSTLCTRRYCRERCGVHQGGRDTRTRMDCPAAHPDERPD